MWMPERLKVWQILFLLFPLLIWLAWSSYSDFTHLEEEGGVLYVGRTTKLLYDLGGKWAVVGFPIFIAGLWGYAIYKTLKLSKKVDELRDEAEMHEVAASSPPRPARPSQPPAAPRKPVAATSPPPAGTSQPPAASRPPTRAPSGPITPLAASAPPAQSRTDDVPPDPSGPKFLR